MLEPHPVPTYQPHQVILSPPPVIPRSPNKKRKAQHYTIPSSTNYHFVDTEVNVDSLEYFQYFGRPFELTTQDPNERQAIQVPFSQGFHP